MTKNSAKYKQKNGKLHERCCELKELSIEAEANFQQRFNTQEAAYLDKVNRLKQRHQIEEDTLRIELASREAEVEKIRSESGKCQREINEIQKKIDANGEQLAGQTEVNRQLQKEWEKMKSDNDHMRMIGEDQRARHAEAQEAFNKELNQLKSEMIKFNELQVEVRQLRDENAQLSGQCEELNTQLSERNLENGRRLLQITAANAPSYADEIDNKSMDELRVLLRAEQDITQRLQSYIGELTLKIMENNPEILEMSIHSNQPKQRPVSRPMQ